MYTEVERLENTRGIVDKLAKGINPFSGEPVQNDSLLNDARIIRSFYFISEVMNQMKRGNYRNRGNQALPFTITPEQKAKIVFSEGSIGVNEFCRCINLCVDYNISRKLTGVELNKRLKKLEVLSEEITEAGKKRTVVNEKSPEYGFASERKSYNGTEYDKVVIDDIGKKYLLDNLETIMAVEL